MNTGSIKRKLQACRRCEFLCTDCPHALPCAVQGQQVKPVECSPCSFTARPRQPTAKIKKIRAIAPMR